MMTMPSRRNYRQAGTDKPTDRFASPIDSMHFQYQPLQIPRTGEYRSSTSSLTSDTLLVCQEHIRCGPIPKTRFEFYAGLTVTAMRGASGTICKTNQALLIDWIEGYDIISDYSEGIGEWDDCSICAVTEVLMGKGGFPFMCGLLVIGKENLYQCCLECVKMCMPEASVNRMDKAIRKYAECHKSNTQ